MNTKLLLVFIILLPFLPYAGRGQAISQVPLRWETDQTFHVLTGEFAEERTILFTFGRDRIEWVRSPEKRHQFEVVKVVGSWHNVSRDGTITYAVRDGEDQGTITFSRERKHTKVRILVMREEVLSITELNISSIQITKE